MKKAKDKKQGAMLVNELPNIRINSLKAKSPNLSNLALSLTLLS